MTLIEVALVTVILTVLLAASAPQFRTTSQRLRAEQAAFELTHLLRAAHEHAVLGAQEMVWTWDADVRVVRVEASGTAGSVGATAPSPGESLQSPKPITSGRFPEGVSVSLTRDDQPVSCQCVRFFPQGTAEPTLLTVRFAQQAYTVTVDAATGQAVLSAGLPVG